MQPVVLPILDANMTHGVVRAWLKREGDAVHAGDPLFEVETDKVNAEVEAEVSGIVRQIVAPVGTRVAVLGVLAFIGDADEAIPAPEAWSTVEEGGSSERAEESFVLEEAPSSQGRSRSPTRSAASPAARRLARQHGIALESLRGSGPRGEITRADIETAGASVGPPAASGMVDSAFLELLRRDPAAFRTLSSEMKVHLYRQHGAHIGEGVRIESGAIIVAQHIDIGAASTIGAETTIDCERLQLGRLVAFGKRTRLRCRSVEIGDALWSKDDVVIGGGGSDEPDACLRAGDACFFGEGAYLNAGQPITLGDEVCIGSRAMLFTHSHWQSVLRGYPSLFAPIEVGDHVFIGNHAFIFPGVTIGAGATVMVNSLVALNVAPGTFVGGVPAQVIRHVTAPSRPEQIGIVRERLMPEIAAVLGERGYRVARHDSGEVITLDSGQASAVLFVPSGDLGSAALPQRAVILAFTEAPAPSVPTGVTLFDLAGSRVFGVQDKLSDEVREVCRRRGMRFRPFAWRYRTGHFEGERFVSRGDRTS